MNGEQILKLEAILKRAGLSVDHLIEVLDGAVTKARLELRRKVYRPIIEKWIKEIKERKAAREKFIQAK